MQICLIFISPLPLSLYLPFTDIEEVKDILIMLLPSPTPNTEGKLVSASSVFTTGIFIKSVLEDSPAARTGMATGDRIVQVGGSKE